MCADVHPTQNAIIDAATELFIANGFHGTSMRQIAEAAGIALGGIYNHFASKEELFAAVILQRHPINQLLPLLEKARVQTPEALFRDGARRMVAAARGDKKLLNLLFIEQVEFKGKHVPLLFDALFPKALTYTQQLMRQSAGMKPESPVIIMRAFFGLVFSHILFELILADTPVAGDEGALDQLMDIFFHGVLEA